MKRNCSCAPQVAAWVAIALLVGTAPTRFCRAQTAKIGDNALSRTETTEAAALSEAARLLRKLESVFSSAALEDTISEAMRSRSTTIGCPVGIDRFFVSVQAAEVWCASLISDTTTIVQNVFVTEVSRQSNLSRLVARAWEEQSDALSPLIGLGLDSIPLYLADGQATQAAQWFGIALDRKQLENIFRKNVRFARYQQPYPAARFDAKQLRILHVLAHEMAHLAPLSDSLSPFHDSAIRSADLRVEECMADIYGTVLVNLLSLREQGSLPMIPGGSIVGLAAGPEDRRLRGACAQAGDLFFGAASGPSDVAWRLQLSSDGAQWLPDSLVEWTQTRPMPVIMARLARLMVESESSAPATLSASTDKLPSTLRGALAKVIEIAASANPTHRLSLLVQRPQASWHGPHDVVRRGAVRLGAQGSPSQAVDEVVLGDALADWDCLRLVTGAVVDSAESITLECSRTIPDLTACSRAGEELYGRVTAATAVAYNLYPEPHFEGGTLVAGGVALVGPSSILARIQYICRTEYIAWEGNRSTVEIRLTAVPPVTRVKPSE